MFLNRFGAAPCAALLLALAPIGAFAQATPHAAGSPAPLATFEKGAEVHNGLLPIVEKNGKFYLEIATSQLGKDFIATAVPASGLGGFGPAPGEPYVAPARILHFDRVNDTVVLRYPNAFALTSGNAAAAAGVKSSLPASVIAVVPVVAQDANDVLIPAAPFLGDVADLAASFRSLSPNPLHGYALDPHRTYFSQAKAFPKNDVLRVDQTWQSIDPATIDNAPDARAVEVTMTYNIIAAPEDGYQPRPYDPRVGFFSQPLIDFATDNELRRDVHYITRWNFGARTSAAPVRAQNPIVFYLSNDIPVEYRQTVKDALLTWNNALAKVGILDAIQVKQQPNDPNWDPDDITHNMIRWIDTSRPQYGAEALIIDDPRSGEELNVGVNFDAIEGIGGRLTYKYEIAPARRLPDSKAAEAAFTKDFIRSVILHESGHDLGLQHNFIGSEAYTQADLESKKFTDTYGVASSVMEYAPINLWPAPMKQGAYVQTVLGPYDYYAVNYGYGYIPASATPAQMQATLSHWASRWNDPKYRFASDEDADGFASGHSVDPRVVTDDLTNKPLAWCGTQMTMLHGVLDAVNARFPEQGQAYDEARAAFLLPLRWYLHCATMPAHTIGGEYLSRAVKGEPGSAAPITPVSLADQRAAWNDLSAWLFSDAPWRFKPAVLDMLTYSEMSSLSVDASWAYQPSPTHGVPVAQDVADAQLATLHELFSPLRLRRIDDAALTFGPGRTITLADLFDWSQSSIFGSIANGKAASDGVVRRNLQALYAKFLGDMLTAPAPGTPSDAQGLARVKLEDLRHETALALRNAHLDELTRAHLEELGAIADQALSARPVVAAPMPAPASRG